MTTTKQHIALKNKPKKGLLFFALLLSLFTLGAAINTAQQSVTVTPLELLLKSNRTAKSAIYYKSAAQQRYTVQYSFLYCKPDLGVTDLVFNRIVATMRLDLIRLALPKRQAFLQYYTNTPHATEPAQHAPYKA